MRTLAGLLLAAVLSVAPAVTLAAEEHGGAVLASAASAEDEDDSEFAFRLGVGYDVPLGRLSLTPLISADLIDGHTTWVYGIALGVGF